MPTENGFWLFRLLSQGWGKKHIPEKKMNELKNKNKKFAEETLSLFCCLQHCHKNCQEKNSLLKKGEKEEIKLQSWPINAHCYSSKGGTC